MTTRLMRKNTIFREEALKDINCPLGIFLDIYPFDNLSDDPKACKKQMRQAWLFSKLLILRSIPFLFWVLEVLKVSWCTPPAP